MKSRITLIWFTFVLIVFSLYGSYRYAPADSPGIRWPLVFFGILLLAISIIFTKKERQRKEKEFCFAESLASKVLKFFFIPGADFFSEDMEKALQRPTASAVSECSMILLIAIIFGSGFLSFSALLPGYEDWYTSAHKDLWVSVYVLSALWFIIFTGILNTLVWIAMRQGYHINITEELENLRDFFDAASPVEDESNFWGRISGKLNHIYGHKTWGGQKMYDLLKEIEENKSKMGTSQWFLLQFASDALDYHVIDKAGITFTYKSIGDYSEFLAKTMGYCNKSMIWITDRKDFDSILLPTMVREVVLSLAMKLVDTNDTIKTSLINMQQYYDEDGKEKAYPHSGAFCDQFCSVSDKQCKTKELCQHESWDGLFVEYTKSWANKVIGDHVGSVCSIKYDKIYDCCIERKTDRFPYPHLRKFYKHPVNKARIIEIPNIPEWPKNPNTRCSELLKKIGEEFNIMNIAANTSEINMLEAIARYYVIDKTGLTELEEKTDDSDDQKQQKKEAIWHIFFHALKLFEGFNLAKDKTNGRANFEEAETLVGFAIVENKTNGIKKMLIKNDGQDELYLDIGIYDNCVMVNSRPEDKDNQDKYRKVQWSILPSPEATFSYLDPKNNEVLKLGDFLDYLNTTWHAKDQ